MIESTTSAGGFIGNLVDRKVEIKNSKSSANVTSNGSKNAGAGGYIGRVSEQHQIGEGNNGIWDDTNYLSILTLNESILLGGSAQSAYASGGLIGLLSNKNMHLNIGYYLNDDNNVVDENCKIIKVGTMVAGNMAGGLIGLIEGKLGGSVSVSTIYNVNVTGIISGQTVGGLIGKIDTDSINLTIGKCNFADEYLEDLENVDTSIEGVIGDEKTTTAGGVIGWLTSLDSRIELNFKTIKIGNSEGKTTISASNNLGGVIGFVEKGDSLPNITNVILNRVGFVVNNKMDFVAWAKDENNNLLIDKVKTYTDYYVWETEEHKNSSLLQSEILTNVTYEKQEGSYSGASVDNMYFGLYVGNVNNDKKKITPYLGRYFSRHEIDKELQDINVTVIVENSKKDAMDECPNSSLSESSEEVKKTSNIIFEVGATIDDVPAGITEDDTAVQAALETARKNLQEQAEKINYIVEVSQIILTGDGTWKLDIDNDLIFKAFTTVAAQNN